MSEEDPWGFDDAEESTPAVADSTAVAAASVSIQSKYRMNTPNTFAIPMEQAHKNQI